MKKVIMFIIPSCPYCKAALKWMDELYASNPAYKKLDVEIIDERKNPEISDQYDYTYVPTYYVDGVKLHDGVASLEKIKRVFDAALED
jgi:glutaredoxin